MQQTNTLIVGASISGLASAASLQKQGKTVNDIIAMDPTKEYKTEFERSAFILLVYDSLKD